MAAFTAGNVLTAAQLNAYLGSVTSAVVTTAQTTSSAAYADLATVGPTVTLTTTGTSALVMVTVQLGNSTGSATNIAAVVVSGATTRAAADTEGVVWVSTDANDAIRSTSVILMTGLTAGSNTWKVQYKTSAGTLTVANRSLVVWPLPL